MTDRLPPGSIIGILGGGQLGQMLAMAAARLGFRCHVYSPRPDDPAARVAMHHTKGAYDDTDAVLAFAKSVDVVTYEFENIPAASAEAAKAGARLRPGVKALETAQDRLIEKRFIRDTAGVPVTPFHDVKHIFDVKRLLRTIDLPIVLKTRRMGYDGKGQVIIREESELEAAFEKFGDAPLIAEEFVNFTREVSVVAGRSSDGQIASYPLIENVHKNHVLHISTAPAKNDTGHAQELAAKIMTALDYVGVMATEFFELEDGRLCVNEIAPRVHNSGHWTQDAGCVDQFELHIRAIAGWPLGNTSPAYGVQMINLIGDDIKVWDKLAADPNAILHIYGKMDLRPGRKMGHVNRIMSASSSV